MPLFRAAEDWDMWVRIASRYALYHLPEVLARYRFSPDPDGVRDRRHYLADLQVVKKNIHLLPPRDQAEVYFVWGRKAKMRRDFQTARRFLFKALILQPKNYQALNLLLRCYISRQVFNTLEESLKIGMRESFYQKTAKISRIGKAIKRGGTERLLEGDPYPSTEGVGIYRRNDEKTV